MLVDHPLTRSVGMNARAVWELGWYESAAALKGDAVASSAFDTLSFTHQREYVEWVEEARRPETRARRVVATVERVAAGKAPA